MNIQFYKISATLFIFISVMTLNSHYNAQSLTQTVKGKVLDGETDSPLIGASVAMIGSETTHSAITDVDGIFSIENVPVGRASFRISYMGYEEFKATDITIGSAKEINLDIRLLESLTAMDEVIVTAKKDNIKPNNNRGRNQCKIF